MYFASDQVHTYMKKQELELVQYYKTVKLHKNSCKYYVISTSTCLCNTFTIKFVKVALLTLFEELLLRNRAMSLMLVFGAYIPLFLSKGTPLFRAFVRKRGRHYSDLFAKIGTLLWLKSTIFSLRSEFSYLFHESYQRSPQAFV